MKAARLAEPGERFFIMGAPPELKANGDTGLALRLVDRLEDEVILDDTTRHLWAAKQQFMVVIIDGRPLNPTRDWMLPRRWVYAQVDDNDTEDAEPAKKTVAA